MAVGRATYLGSGLDVYDEPVRFANYLCQTRCKISIRRGTPMDLLAVGRRAGRQPFGHVRQRLACLSVGFDRSAERRWANTTRDAGG